LYTQDELAEMFKVSRSTIFRQRKAQNWPHHLIGTEIRFAIEDIEAIKAMNRKAPQRDRSQAPRIPKRGEALRPRIPRSPSISKQV
jgi:hypothetical protein